MTRVNGNPKIVIVKGDSFTREVVFEGENIIDFIDSVYFSCEKLSLCKELEYIGDNTYILELKPNETIDLEVGTTTFDLTIKFSEEEVKTVQYKSIITILEKNNKVVCL